MGGKEIGMWERTVFESENDVATYAARLVYAEKRIVVPRPPFYFAAAEVFHDCKGGGLAWVRKKDTVCAAQTR